MMALIGFIMERSILEPLQHGGQLVAILATFGVSVVLDNVMFQVFGANTQSLSPYMGDLSWASWGVGDFYISKLAALLLATAIAVLGGLQLFLNHTPLGRAIRATAQDPDTAGLVGIDARRARAVATSIAFVTIGLAGARAWNARDFHAVLRHAAIALRFPVDRDRPRRLDLGHFGGGHHPRPGPNHRC